MEEQDINRLLVQGFKAAKEQRREEAYQIFCEVVQRDPSNENGWLYRAATTEDLAEAYVCLQRVLSLNPDNVKAQRGLERLKSRMTEEGDGADDDMDNASAGVGAAGIAASNAFDAGAFSTPPPVVPQNRSFSEPGTADFDAPATPAPFSFEPPDTGGFNAPTFQPDRYQPEPPGDRQPFSSGFNLPDDDNDDNFFRRGDNPPQYRIPTPQDDYNYGTPPPPPPPGQRERLYDLDEVQANQSNPYPPFAQEQDDYEQDAPMSARAAFAQASQNRVQANEMGNYDDDVGMRQSLMSDDVNTSLNSKGRSNRRNMRSILIVAFLGVLVLVLFLVYYLIQRNNVPDNTVAGVDTAATATADAALGTPGTAASGTASPGTTSGANVTSAATTGATGTGSPPATAQATTGAANPTTGAATSPAGATNPTATRPATQPTTAPPPPAATPTPANRPPNALPRAIIHTIAIGDNLTSLATRYSTTWEAIVAANRLVFPIVNINQVVVGNRYIIPVSRPDFRGRAIIVAPNETLDAIAGRLGVTANQIITLNGLASPTDFKPGDVLLVP